MLLDCTICRETYGSGAGIGTVNTRQGAQTDPKGPSSGSYRMIRGACYGKDLGDMLADFFGSIGSDTSFMYHYSARSALRVGTPAGNSYDMPTNYDFGFRVVRPAQ